VNASLQVRIQGGRMTQCSRSETDSSLQSCRSSEFNHSIFARRPPRGTLDALETAANDRSGDYQSNGSEHLEHFSFAIQSRTSGAGLPPHPGPKTLVPQWGHLIRLRE